MFRIVGAWLWRLSGACLTLMLVIATCMALLRAVPGGPFDHERSAPPEVQAVLAARYKIDQPFVVQLYDYLDGALSGDLGPSFHQLDFSVTELLASALPLTLGLGGVSLLLSLGLAVISAWAVAMTGSRWLQRTVSGCATLLQATPKFVLGPLLILCFALALGWFPVAAYGTGTAGWLLPILTLALPQWAWLHRVCLAELKQVLRSPAWRAEYARGGSVGKVWVYLGGRLLAPRLCMASLPVAIALLSGSAVVESVFSIPGMGRLLIQGALNRDYTVVLGVVSVSAALVLLLGLCADMGARWLDPRLRRS